MNPEERERVIVRTSIIGIVANVLLVAFKAVVGLASNAIAIVLDAVNNLTDALSSVITIIGAKLAGKRANRAHPLGYGRYEYLSALVIVAIVLYAGITSLIESVRKIIEPELADYSAVTLIVVAAAVVVKIVLGRYVSAKGRQVGSGSLVASGKDALFDAAISASVLAAALIYLATGVSLEAYVGVLISIVIVKAGIDMLRETLDDILEEAFAVCREASRRVLGLRHYDVQLIGGMVLHSGAKDVASGNMAQTAILDEQSCLSALAGARCAQQYDVHSTCSFQLT